MCISIAIIENTMSCISIFIKKFEWGNFSNSVPFTLFIKQSFFIGNNVVAYKKSNTVLIV